MVRSARARTSIRHRHAALDATTGKLKWHFQFSPHDTHDWDSTHVPVLIDALFRGQPRKLVVVANRNGFYYTLDRVTGEFLLGKAFAKQTWAKGLDERGRARISLPQVEQSPEGLLLYPGLHGATNWNSPSYSPPNAAALFGHAHRRHGLLQVFRSRIRAGLPFHRWRYTRRSKRRNRRGPLRRSIR